MEKSRQAEVIVDVARRQQRLERRLYGLITVALAFCVLGLWNYVRLPEYGYGDYAESTSHVVTSPDNEKFTNWELIEPSEELNWVPCFRGDFVEEFYCSRLTVPLDYNRPLHASKSNPKVHIALVMLPGRNHTETGTWSESPMLINPGGPGGEGTRLLLGRGKALQTIAGTDRDVIGFDPRGIGATTPHADCFAKDGKGDAGSLLRRDLWQMGSLAVGLANTSSTATETMVLRGRGLTKLCSTQDEENSILRYAGTPNVAQDMLSIVEAWDRWSSKESSGSLQVKSSVELRRRDGQPSGLSTKGKLVYWGFSYGTVLGATFATMFPDKVGRMVLDGVADSDQWFLENYWIGSSEDADEVVKHFLLHCHEVQDACALYRSGDKLEDVKARYDAVFTSLIEKPRVYAIPGNTPFTITYSDLKMLNFVINYVPVRFPVLALVLDALYREVDMATLMPPVDLAPVCGMDPRDLLYPSEGQIAVLCSDERGPPLNESKAGLDNLLNKMTEISSYGPVLFGIEANCAGWDIKQVDPPSFRWDDLPLTEKGPVNTSFPILFVSNSRDPVTPLSAGLRQVRKFADAGFVEQTSEGHCSISSVSFCTLNKIQDYFQNGVVPDKPVFDNPEDGSLKGHWTVCKLDQPNPFKPPNMWPLEGQDATEAQVMHAGLELQKEFATSTSQLGFPVLQQHAFSKLIQLGEEETVGLLKSYNPDLLQGM